MSIIPRNNQNDYEELITIYMDNFHETFLEKLNDLFVKAVSSNPAISATFALEMYKDYNTVTENINQEFAAVIKKNLVLDDKVRSYKMMIEELYDKYEEEDDQ